MTGVPPTPYAVPGLHNLRVQIDCYAKHYREARNLAYAAAAAMDSMAWRLGITPFPEDDERIYRWMLEVSVWRNDAPEDIPPFVAST